MTKGGCTDLRNKGPNGPVKVFSAGKLVRIEKATTIDDFITRQTPPRVGSRKDEHWVPWVGK